MEFLLECCLWNDCINVPIMTSLYPRALPSDLETSPPQQEVESVFPSPLSLGCLCGLLRPAECGRSDGAHVLTPGLKTPCRLPPMLLEPCLAAMWISPS